MAIPKEDSKSNIKKKSPKSIRFQSNNQSDSMYAEEAIKEYFEFHFDYLDGWISPKMLASKIGRNYHTVRGRCLFLSKKPHKTPYLLRKRIGRMAYYRPNRRYPDDLIRANQLPNVKFPLIHGLVLYANDIINQEGILGIKCIFCAEKINENFICSICNYPFRTYPFQHKRKVGFGRNVSWSFGKQKHSIRINFECSESPLRFRDFQHLLSAIGSASGINIYENIHLFKVLQVGINHDGKIIYLNESECRENKSLIQQFTLSNFSGWLAKRYKKQSIFDGTEYQRTEIHFNKEFPLDNFLAAIQGTLTTSQIANTILLMKNQFDNLANEVRSLVQFMKQEKREKQLEREKQSKREKKG